MGELEAIWGGGKSALEGFWEKVGVEEEVDVDVDMA